MLVNHAKPDRFALGFSQVREHALELFLLGVAKKNGLRARLWASQRVLDASFKLGGLGSRNLAHPIEGRIASDGPKPGGKRVLWIEGRTATVHFQKDLLSEILSRLWVSDFFRYE